MYYTSKYTDLFLYIFTLFFYSETKRAPSSPLYYVGDSNLHFSRALKLIKLSIHILKFNIVLCPLVKINIEYR